MIDFRAVRGVLLDLDGTLLDTAPEIAAAASSMLAELGLEPVEDSEVRTFIGKGIPHLVRRTLEASLGRAPDERRIGSGIESFFFNYEKHNGRTARPYSGVIGSGVAARGKRPTCLRDQQDSAIYRSPPGCDRACAVFFRRNLRRLRRQEKTRARPYPRRVRPACAHTRRSFDGRRLFERRSRGPGSRLPGGAGPIRVQRGRGCAIPRQRWYSPHAPACRGTSQISVVNHIGKNWNSTWFGWRRWRS